MTEYAITPFTIMHSSYVRQGQRVFFAYTRGEKSSSFPWHTRIQEANSGKQH